MEAEVHWDSLRFLLSLQANGSVIAAAKALGVAPAVVVKRLHSLEAVLRLKLFDGIDEDAALTFTESGRFVLAQAAHISESVNSLTARARVRHQRQNLVIGSTEGFGTHWIVPRLSALRHAVPDVDVTLLVGPGEADFYLQPATYMEGLQNRLVGTMPFLFYASEGYLSEKGHPSSFEDMVKNHNVILASYYFDEGPWVGWAQDLKDRAQNIVLYTDSSSAVVSAVRNGLGIALMSGYAQKVYADLVPCLTVENWQDFTLPVILSCDASRLRLPHVDAAISFFMTEVAKGI